MGDSVKYKYEIYSEHGTPLKYTGELCRLPDAFCPRCGSKDVYKDQLNDVYYFGHRHICLKCMHAYSYLLDGDVLKIEEEV